VTPGSAYDRYQIVRMLGHGAMGTVYLATDAGLSDQFALKIVHNGTDRADQEIVAAERLGAELQKRLAVVDSRVCQVHRYEERDGDLYIEMEYVEGDDLSTILASGPMAHGMAVRVAIELCEMLEHLKAFTALIDGKQFTGVIHGDLKPKNIRLTRHNKIKVLDFGIAKALSHTHQYTTNLFASSAYCSPERLETQHMDADSDLWSVGVLLYQMLANRLPFDDENRERLERRIRSGCPDPLPENVPEPLRRVVLKMLARDLHGRYPSASALREDLERFTRGEDVKATLVEARLVEYDATVRSVSPIATDDRTVRITPVAMPPVVPVRPRNHLAIGCMAVLGAMFLAGSGFAVLEMRTWDAADDLKADIKNRRIQPDQAWDRYQVLSKRTHLPGTMWSVSNALRQEQEQVAEDPIREFRSSDAPVIYRQQWAQAHNALARALELDPDNRTIQGKLALVEAHIDRIDAAGRNAPRQKLLNTAVTKFEQAGELLRNSPDPYLGLARLYVYDLLDVDRAEDALKKASEYGHPMGRRERAQLADGYKRRADRTWRDSRAYTQTPGQEKDYLNRAKEDYVHAQDLYREVGMFGDAARNEVQAMQGQQRVEQRLSQIEL
jgi:hypothetical protein